MISRIRIQGLGSLYDVDVRLSALTLLLGPNASGKSSFIRALVLLSRLLRSPIRGEDAPLRVDHATLDELLSVHQDDGSLSLSVWLDHAEGAPSYSITLGRSEGLWCVLREQFRAGYSSFDSSEQERFEFQTERRGMVGWQTPGSPPRHASLPFLARPYRRDQRAGTVVPPLITLVDSIGYAYPYRVNPDDLVDPTLPPWIKPDQLHVQKSGAGFPHRLQQWVQTIEGGAMFREAVLPQVQRLFPHIENVGFRGSPSRLFIEYQTSRAANPIPANLESDGVNLALFYHCIPYLLNDDLGTNPRTPICLCLEEPETGTHPRFQKLRLELLREISNTRLGERPFQVVATTHSVDLVRWVHSDEVLDVLRFVEYLDPERGSAIHRLTRQEDVDRILQLWDGDVGAAWYSNAFAPGPAEPAVADAAVDRR